MLTNIIEEKLCFEAVQGGAKVAKNDNFGDFSAPWATPLFPKPIFFFRYTGEGTWAYSLGLFYQYMHQLEKNIFGFSKKKPKNGPIAPTLGPPPGEPIWVPL